MVHRDKKQNKTEHWPIKFWRSNSKANRQVKRYRPAENKKKHKKAAGLPNATVQSTTTSFFIYRTSRLKINLCGKSIAVPPAVCRALTPVHSTPIIALIATGASQMWPPGECVSFACTILQQTYKTPVRYPFSIIDVLCSLTRQNPRRRQPPTEDSRQNSPPRSQSHASF